MLWGLELGRWGTFWSSWGTFWSVGVLSPVSAPGVMGPMGTRLVVELQQKSISRRDCDSQKWDIALSAIPLRTFGARSMTRPREPFMSHPHPAPPSPQGPLMGAMTSPGGWGSLERAPEVLRGIVLRAISHFWKSQFRRKILSCWSSDSKRVPKCSGKAPLSFARI